MKNIENKSRQLEELIREKIVSGEYAPGSRIAGERVLGELFQLSRCTVRRAIDQLYREQILVKAESRGTFVATEALKLIVAGKNVPVRGRVTMFLPPQQIYNPFYQHLVACLTQKIAPGIALDVSFKYCLCQAEEEAAQTGVNLLYGNYPQVDLTEFCAAFANTIVINRKLPGANYISTDNYRGGELICDYILHCGHRHIGCIHMASSSLEANDYSERLRGFRNRLERDGIFFAAQASAADGMMKNYDCGSLVNALLRKAPRLTAIVCLNDALAISVYDALSNRKISIPDEISVIGFDDQYLTQFMSPPLTTAKVSLEEMAQELASVINARLMNGTPLVLTRELTPRLTERASVKTKS